MAGNDFLESALRGFLQKQDQDRSEQEAIQQQLIPFLSQLAPTVKTDPQDEAIRRLQAGAGPAASESELTQRANPVFEQVLGAITEAQGGSGLLGKLQGTEGGGFLGSIARGAGRFLEPTFGDRAGGPGEDVLRTVGAASQGVREQQRGQARGDLTFELGERARFRAPGRVSETAGEKEAGRLGARDAFRTDNPEGFAAQFPERAGRTPNSRERITTELAKSGFIQTPLGIVDLETGLNVRSGQLSPERRKDANDAVLRAGAGGASSVQAPPDEDPTGLIDPQALKDELEASFQAEEQRLGRGLTQEEEDIVTQGFTSGQ